MSSLAMAENSTFAKPVVEVEARFDEIPAVIRAELNADSDRDILDRMRHLARKKRMRQPDITEAEMADYLALAENCRNFSEWQGFRRGALESTPSRAAVAWVLGTLAVVGLLTIGLITSIAVSVSGL